MADITASTAAVDAAELSAIESLSELQCPFDGTGDPRTAVAWLSDIGDHLFLNSCPERHRILFAKLQLTGPARIWYYFLEPKPTDWDEFETAFFEEYCDIAQAEAYQKEWITLHPKCFPTVKELGTHIGDLASISRALGTTAYSAEDMKDRFVECLLSDPRLIDLAMWADHRRANMSFNSLVKYVTNYERLAPLPSGRAQRPAQSAGGSSDRSQNRRMTPQLRQLLRDSKSCFYCRQPGHIRADCPKRKRAGTEFESMAGGGYSRD